MPLCVRSSTVRAYGLGLPHSREYYARGRLLLQDQDELLHPPSRFRDMQQISRDKFDCFLRATTEFTLCVLARYGLRDHWPARPTLTPPIRFLYIGSRICSTLPSDPASRRRPCASLSLLLYQDVKRTFTSKLSNMLGVPKKGPRRGLFHFILESTLINRLRRWPPPPESECFLRPCAPPSRGLP